MKTAEEMREITDAVRKEQQEEIRIKTAQFVEYTIAPNIESNSAKGYCYIEVEVLKGIDLSYFKTILTEHGYVVNHYGNRNYRIEW